jgi:hypothetical protein
MGRPWRYEEKEHPHHHNVCRMSLLDDIFSRFSRLRGGGGRPNDDADGAAGANMVVDGLARRQRQCQCQCHNRAGQCFSVGFSAPQQSLFPLGDASLGRNRLRFGSLFRDDRRLRMATLLS